MTVKLFTGTLSHNKTKHRADNDPSRKQFMDDLPPEMNLDQKWMNFLTFSGGGGGGFQSLSVVYLKLAQSLSRNYPGWVCADVLVARI